MPDPAEFDSIRTLRRHQIVAEGRRLVAAEGLSALTIGALEKRLPFSRGVITHHFRDKDELVQGVLDSALDEIDQATRTDLSQAQALEERVRAVLRTKVLGFLENVEASRILVSFWSRIPSDPRATIRNGDLFRRYRRQGLRLFAEARAQGLVHDDVDPEAAAALLVAVVIGLVTQALFDPDSLDPETAVEQAVQVVMLGVTPR